MRKSLLKAVFVLACSSASASAFAVECPTELKATDTFKELSATLKCLNDRIKALEGQRGTSAKSGNAPAAPAGGFNVTVLKGSASASAGQYQIDIVKCQISNDTLKCALSVTSRGKDGQAYISVSDSRLFDTHGRDFRAIGADIGGVSTSPLKNAEKDLIADLPTVANVEFPADDRVVGIAVLRLHVCGDGLKICQTASFRNIVVN